MKKFRILSALLALILCASMLLTACGKKNKDDDEVEETDPIEEEEIVEEEAPTVELIELVNKDWKAEANKTGVISKATKLDVKGSFLHASNSLVIFNESNPATGTFPTNSTSKSAVHVYNANTDKVILTLNNSTSAVEKEVSGGFSTYTRTLTTYNYDYIDVINNEYFAVLNVKRMNVSDRYTNDSVSQAYSFNEGYFAEYSSGYLYSFNEDEKDVDDAYVTYTLTIYDATGKAVRTINHEQFKTLCSDSIYNFSYNNRNVYKTLTDRYQPETAGGDTCYDLIVKDGKVYRNDKDGKPTLVKDYGMSKMPNWDYLSKSGDYYFEESGSTYIVYDKDLNKTLDYTVPGYAYSSRAFVLADGSVLAQYTIQLNQDVTEFDYRAGADGKYDLVTVLATKEGTEELKDVNYYINYVEASVADETKNYFNDEVENLAIIYPIGENKMLDRSYGNMKLVTLSNDCKTVVEIVSDEKITDFPTPITDDLFAVSVLGGGKMIFDENGEKKAELESFSTYNLFAGKYILQTEGIYDLTGKKLYDFKANEATYVNMGDALLITAIADNGDVKYYRWADGNAVEITGKEVNGSSYGYYYVVSETTKDGATVKSYSYFNTKGEAIGVYESTLSVKISTDDYVIVSVNAKNATTNTWETHIYKLTITK